MHDLYEKQRLIADEKSVGYIKLRDEMLALSDNFIAPKNINKVVNKK